MNIIKKILSSSFAKSSILVLFLSNLGLGIQYVSQILLGRFLTSEEYVLYNSLTSIGMVCCSFATVYPYLLSRYSILSTNQLVGSGLKAAFSFSKQLLKASLFICLVLAIILPNILKIFSVANLKNYLFTISIIFLGYGYSILLGLLQSQFLYYSISIQNITNSILRFVFIVIFCLLLDMGLDGGLLSVNLGTIAGGILSFYYIRKLFLTMSTKEFYLPKILPIVKEIFPVGITLILMSLLLHVDLIIIPFFLEGYLAGSLSKVLMASRVAYFLPGLIYFIVFPEVAKLDRGNKKIFLILIYSVGLALLVSLSFVISTFIFPEEIMKILFNAESNEIFIFLGITSISFMLLAIIQILWNFLIGLKIFSFLYIITPSVLLYLVSFFIFSDKSSNSIIFIHFSGTFCIFTVTIFLIYFIYRKRSFFSWELN